MSTIEGVGTEAGRSKWYLVALVAITLVGLALRLWTAYGTRVDVPIRNDARDYTSYAANLSLHGTYSSNPLVLVGRLAGPPAPDAKRPPGYAMFLAAFFTPSDLGGFVHRVVVAQAWLGALAILLAGWLAGRLLGEVAGVGVAAFVALSPHLAVYVPYLLSETLYALALVCFVAAGALALGQGHRGRRLGLTVLCGVFLGVLCMLRPTLDQLIWVLVLTGMVAPALRGRRMQVLVLLGAYLAVMAPWWGRNLSLPPSGQSHAMAITIHQGSYPDLMRDGDPATFGYPYRGDPAAAVAESSLGAALGDLVGKFRDHPLRMARWYLIGKPMQLFAWEEQSGWMDLFEYPVLRSPWLDQPALIALMSVMGAIHPIAMLLGLLGTLLAFWPAALRLAMLRPTQAVGLRLVAFVHGYFVLVHLAALPLSRYSVPFRPLSYLLAAFALLCLVRLLQRLREKASLAAGEAKPA